MNLFELLTSSVILVSLLITVCISLPFLALAGYLIYRARKTKQVANASQSWPSVMGMVLSSQVTSHTSSRPRGGHTTSYSPHVVYEYQVLGHTYQSDRLSFATVTLADRQNAQSIVDRYIPGNAVRVYYDPNNPGEATLERSAGNSAKWLYAIAIILIIMVIGTACTSILTIVLPLLAAHSILNILPTFTP